MKETKTVYRAVRQYSKPLPDDTMEFLRGIALDYAKVKAYVFQRYAGISSIEKLYPGYTIQNEMNATGFRQQLNLPYPYYSQAMFEAIGNIKSGWSNLKNKIVSLVKKNENLTDVERHYIFTILKVNKLYAAVLNRREFECPAKFKDSDIDFKRLHNLICRLTRKYMTIHGEGSGDYFKVINTGFRYADGGLWLGTRISNRRSFIPLTDNAKHTKQLTVKILDNKIEVIAPVESKVKARNDYTEKTALYLGYLKMFTSSNGSEYGSLLGEMLSARSERIYEKNRRRGKYYGLYRNAIRDNKIKIAAKIKTNNLGTLKFVGKNNREMLGIKSYINSEINRMLQTEKPSEIVIPARTPQFSGNMQKATKQKLARWVVGYIRKRLSDKCTINGIKLTEVNGAYTSLICAVCGKPGKRMNQQLVCKECDVRHDYPHNSARNLLKKSDGSFKIPAEFERTTVSED
jgi:IS605 OrfB family transposase